jgi:type IV secretory pathway VirJ component
MKMHRIGTRIAIVLLIWTTTVWAAGLDESTLEFGRFGTVHLYRQSAHPARVVLFVSGDGGWNLGVVDMARELAGLGALVVGIDRKIAGELAAHGVGVVALDSLKYFWTARTPEGSARDLAQLLEYYLGAWHKEKAVLIGYSLGADVLPLMAARLPADIRRRVAVIALLAPGRQTAFEFHLSDWIGGSQGAEYPTGPEVDKLTDLPLLCFYGEEEGDSLCSERLPPNVTVIPMAGSHHLGGDYTSIVGRILQAMARP